MVKIPLFSQVPPKIPLYLGYQDTHFLLWGRPPSSDPVENPDLDNFQSAGNDHYVLIEFGSFRHLTEVLNCGEFENFSERIPSHSRFLYWKSDQNYKLQDRSNNKKQIIPCIEVKRPSEQSIVQNLSSISEVGYIQALEH